MNNGHARTEDPVLIFLHLPKCGGTTLNRIIEWEYPLSRIFSVDPSFFRWSHRKVCRWSQAHLDRMQVFKGHMPFGLHTRLSRPATYITFLREPVERVISEYYFARHHRLHPQHKRMQKLTLSEYALGTPHHNMQTKLIAGHGNYPDFLAGDCDNDVLQTARDHLAHHFSFVGLTERFDEGLAKLKLMFGWNINRYANFNVTRVRLQKEKIPVDVQELIADRNRYDCALYRHVEELYAMQIGAESGRLQDEITAIRAAKSLGPVRSAAYMATSTARKAVCRLLSAL
jgi:hypothetical protein